METDLSKPGFLDGEDRGDRLRRAKSYGFSDIRLGELSGKTEDEIRGLRQETGIRPVFKRG